MKVHWSILTVGAMVPEKVEAIKLPGLPGYKKVIFLSHVHMGLVGKI